MRVSAPFQGVINFDACGSMNDTSWTTCCSCKATPLVDHESASFERATKGSIHAAKPALKSVWRHGNGALYIIRLFTNIESANPAYPETIVYEGAAGRMWSRPLCDRHRSMTPL